MYNKNILSDLQNLISNTQIKTREFGEVLTPVHIDEKMLDTLPIELYKNPDLNGLCHEKDDQICVFDLN